MSFEIKKTPETAWYLATTFGVAFASWDLATDMSTLVKIMLALIWVLFCLYMGRRAGASERAEARAEAKTLVEDNALVRCSIGIMCEQKMFRRADMLELPGHRYCCPECRPTLNDTDIFGEPIND